MKCKAFDVELELEVQAVTCPGVWLCPNGKVTVQIYLLGLCTQTSTLNPVFPLLCHEKFTFRKNFPNIQNLCELDQKLSREIVYMELIQWEDCDTGNVLATFKTSLMELLYPFPKRKGILAGVDVDLLMEATRKFPGIISPKVEISTKITIKEILCSVKFEKKNEVTVVNPKLISSKCVPKRNTPMRQKKVCHTYKYHKAKTNKMQNNSCLINHCTPAYSSARSPRRNSPRKSNCGYHQQENLSKDYVHEKVKKLRNCNYADSPCDCKEKGILCPLCAKYKCYFPNSCRCCVAQDNTLLCKCTKLDEIKETSEYEDIEKNNKKKCRCNTAAEKSPRSCIHSQKLKSRASEIHDRLQRAFSTPTCLSLAMNDNMYEGETCTDKFYKNLEQFYKQLYMRAHYKLKNERCKCGK